MNLKNEKGSITVYVLVAVFFLLAIIAGRFLIANRNLKIQYDSLGKVKTLYEAGPKIYKEEIEPEPSPTPTIDPNEPKVHEINIFNADAFLFFAGQTSYQRFYVYQVGLHYIFNESARQEPKDVLVSPSSEYTFKYKLMSDIRLGDNYSGEAITNMTLTKNLDFNSHIIYTDGSLHRYVFYNTTNKTPAIGNALINKSITITYNQYYTWNNNPTLMFYNNTNQTKTIGDVMSNTGITYQAWYTYRYKLKDGRTNEWVRYDADNTYNGTNKAGVELPPHSVAIIAYTSYVGSTNKGYLDNSDYIVLSDSLLNQYRQGTQGKTKNAGTITAYWEP